MTRSDPKMIINLNLKDTEFEDKIKLAVDKYVESIVDGYASEALDAALTKYIDNKIKKVVQEARYDNASLIHGKNFTKYVRELAQPKVEEIMDKLIEKMNSEKLTTLITK